MAVPRQACKAASTQAVLSRSLDTGLCQETTWWHQLWDLMGKPVCDPQV